MFWSILKHEFIITRYVNMCVSVEEEGFLPHTNWRRVTVDRRCVL